jgi:hypothetical protein
MHVVYFKQAEDHSQSLRLICLDRGLGVGKAVVNDLIDKFEDYSQEEILIALGKAVKELTSVALN